MRSRWLALAMCALLMVTSGPRPPAAHAEGGSAATADALPADQPPAIGDDAGIDRWDWGKFFAYAACGAAVVSATGGIGLVAVGIACGRAASLYWNT